MAQAVLPPMPNPCTHAASAAWVAACEAVLRRHVKSAATVWTVAPAAVEVFDSSALAAILAVQRQVHAQGQHLQCPPLPEGLASLVRLYGLQDVMPT